MAQSGSGRSVSLWMVTAHAPACPPLDEDVTADACVIGAGITGLFTAYCLVRAGLSVVVLEDGPVGGGDTGRTTAHLTTALDSRYSELARQHGENATRLIADSHRRAIDALEAVVTRERIACGFERVEGFLFAARPGDVAALHEEQEAAARAGLETEITRAPVSGAPLALCFSSQAQFQPLDFVMGLADAIRRAGGRIFTGTHASSFEPGPPARIETDRGGSVTARVLVVATHTPVNDRVTIHTKQAPYRTYVLAARIPPRSVTKALYWDTEDPYHYVRLQETSGGPTWLIVGGEDHKTGQADDAIARHRRLEAWMRDHYPTAGPVEFRWSGQVFEPVDGLGMIGRNPGDENVFVATGYAGNGMTHAAVAGLLIRDLVLGRANAWSEVYDPGRITLRAAPEFAAENANVARQYLDLVTPGEVEAPDSIAPGSGAIVRDGLKKLAVYRDSAGHCHALSAFCTHLGCVVAWNSGEGTWDCPCHGSRFATDGRVLTGPANAPLAAAEVPELADK
jgi:glycine/D-amino acid oxidase-like deaminating enzyme/nitrite reductase/ring-hydroxylating ferredoxin subunit